MWHVVISKIATLQEIETHWSLDDLVRAHLALEYNEYMIEKARKDAR